MRKKKLLFVINYFYPDYESTGQLLTELCLQLQNDFEITVIAQLPNREPFNNTEQRFSYDLLENIKIVRIKLPKVDKSKKWSRIKYILSYFLFALIAVWKQRNVDLIYTISSPPIIGGLIGTIGKWLKRTKHIYNIQDFNPEQAEAVSFTNKVWIFRLARLVDNVNCRFADHIVTVGQDMQETLIRRFGGINVPSNSVINNWTDENEIVPLNKDHPKVKQFLMKYGLLDKFIVMYSGNLGLYYDLENIIRVTETFASHKQVAFVFIGDGAVKGQMQSFVEAQGLSNVHFIPFQPKDQIIYSLNAADVHLVVNQKGIKGVSVPSKIYGVMAAGKPILGVLEQGSEARRLIEESDCGLAVEPQQYPELCNKIHEIVKMKSEDLRQIGLNGRTYLEQGLKKENAIEKYKMLLKEIS